METIELMVMHAEHHKLTVLWTACRIGPNAAEAAVTADYRKISARREVLHRGRQSIDQAQKSIASLSPPSNALGKSNYASALVTLI